MLTVSGGVPLAQRGVGPGMLIQITGGQDMVLQETAGPGMLIQIRGG